MKIKHLVQLAVLAVSVAPMASCKLVGGHEAIAVMAARTKVDHNGHDVAVFSYSLTPSNTTENDIRVKLEWKDQDAVGDVYDYLSAEIDHDRQEFSVTKLADFDQVAKATIYSFAHPGISASTEIHLSEKFLGFKNSYLSSDPVVPLRWKIRTGGGRVRTQVTGWEDFIGDATNGFSTVFTDSISHDVTFSSLELLGERFDWYDPDDEIEAMPWALSRAIEDAFDDSEAELWGEDSPYWEFQIEGPLISASDHATHWRSLVNYLTDEQMDVLDAHSEGIEAQIQYSGTATIAGVSKGFSVWFSYLVYAADYQAPVE